MTGMLGSVASCSCAHRCERSVHIGSHLPPQIHPPEPETDPHQQVFHFRRQDIGPHIVLRDKHNDSPAPEVTNSRHSRGISRVHSKSGL